MIIITNYNKKSKTWLPMLSLINDIKETKKQIKKQIIDQIINEPETLKAYKQLEIYKVGEIDEKTMKIEKTEKELLFSYEELLNEIIEDLTEKKEKKENAKN